MKISRISRNSYKPEAIKILRSFLWSESMQYKLVLCRANLKAWEVESQGIHFTAYSPLPGFREVSIKHVIATKNDVKKASVKLIEYLIGTTYNTEHIICTNLMQNSRDLCRIYRDSRDPCRYSAAGEGKGEGGEKSEEVLCAVNPSHAATNCILKLAGAWMWFVDFYFKLSFKQNER